MAMERAVHGALCRTTAFRDAVEGGIQAAVVVTDKERRSAFRNSLIVFVGVV
jgi:hypothetical protein